MAHASNEQTGQPSEQHSRSTVQAEREWQPFLLVACVGRRLDGVLRVVALLSPGRVRYCRRSFNMAQGAQDFRFKNALLIIAPANNRVVHL
jgi:hypothetical protein